MNLDLEGYVYEFPWLKRTRDDDEVVSFYYFFINQTNGKLFFNYLVGSAF